MSAAERRRLHDDELLVALMRDERVAPAMRVALQLGAKIGEARRRRMSFLAGLVVGILVGAILAIILVRYGAAEGQR